MKDWIYPLFPYLTRFQQRKCLNSTEKSNSSVNLAALPPRGSALFSRQGKGTVTIYQSIVHLHGFISNGMKNAEQLFILFFLFHIIFSLWRCFIDLMFSFNGLVHYCYWWLVRVTLVVVFGFLAKHFRRWQGPTNYHFARKGMQLQWC